MKIVWILYDMVVDDEIMDMFNELHISGYTKWPRLIGNGPQSGSRLDNHIWPGANMATFTVVEDAVATQLMQKLQTFRDEVGKMTGVWAFTTPILESLV